MLTKTGGSILLAHNPPKWVNFAGRSTAYTAALRRAGLSGIGIHQIRHTVAVRMLAAGKGIAAPGPLEHPNHPEDLRSLYAGPFGGRSGDFEL